MRPDESLFNSHIKYAEFQMGMDEGRWGIAYDDNDLGLNWPFVIIWIKY